MPAGVYNAGPCYLRSEMAITKVARSLTRLVDANLPPIKDKGEQEIMTH